jgi:hypothetical protein
LCSNQKLIKTIMNTFLLIYGTIISVAFILISIDANKRKNNPNQKWTRLESNI